MSTSTAPTDSVTTRCCVVGGGPAGVVLAYLLARAGVDTVLLEEHEDFDRDFRGDTIHPSVLRIMDELGLADRLLQLRHTKIRQITLQSGAGPVPAVDFTALPTRYPYIAMIPQADFLEFMSREAAEFPTFHPRMGAGVRELIYEDGVVRGVRSRDHAGWHEVRALLTVAADGRFSRMRRLAGMTTVGTSPPMDILWFRLSRRADDREDAVGHFGQGHILGMFSRYDYWQVAYVIPKGTYRELHDSGLDHLRRNVAALAPELSDRVHELTDWRKVSLLSVESDRLARWYRRGLLFIWRRRAHDVARWWSGYQLCDPGRSSGGECAHTVITFGADAHR